MPKRLNPSIHILHQLRSILNLIHCVPDFRKLCRVVKGAQKHSSFMTDVRIELCLLMQIFAQICPLWYKPAGIEFLFESQQTLHAKRSQHNHCYNDEYLQTNAILGIKYTLLCAYLLLFPVRSKWCSGRQTSESDAWDWDYTTIWWTLRMSEQCMGQRSFGSVQFFARPTLKWPLRT